MSSAAALHEELAADIASYTHNPKGYVRYAFPWGEGELDDSNGPREWQDRILGAIGDHLRNPAARHQPCCIAVSSGHGIGKSALVGMLIDWAMSTCEHCKVVVTAGTGTQLSTKTVPEVSKWFRMAVNADWWDVQAQSIKFKSAKLQKTWRTDFITWSEHNTEAFAGLHNKGKRILLVFDEASAIADKVWEVAEGAMTDENTEIIWLAFGNPTQNTGRFRECFGKYAHRWKSFQIDSRTVEGTNKEQIDKWIEDYGEDSDFCRVRVRGEFPRAGSNQFIPSDLVAIARKTKVEPPPVLPLLAACDVARFGDDQSVIGDRKGRRARIYKRFRGLDVIQLAERCIEYIDSERPDAFVVDGDGIGAGVFDYLKHRGYDRKTLLVEFHGGSTPNDPNQYFNRRAEVWGLLREWLKEGAAIPDDPELDTDLTAPQYGFSAKQQIQLEKKDDMKKRGLSSPDSGDCLAMTFAVKVAPKKPALTGPPPRMSAWA